MNRGNMKQEIMKAPASPKAKKKVEKVMGEFKRGKLKSGSGQKVKSRDQAIAIALSEARGAMQRKYGGKGITMYKDSVMRRFDGGTADKPVAYMPSKEEQEKKARLLAEEKKKQAMQAVEDEKKRRQMQEAYKKATSQKTS